MVSLMQEPVVTSAPILLQMDYYVFDHDKHQGIIIVITTFLHDIDIGRGFYNPFSL
ncbi:MAG: hypothetical protein ACJ70O_05915 [Nitrososphaera sp.]